MANTRYLTTAVEDHVRNVLSAEHQVVFRKRRLRLQTGGYHEFDAVAANCRVVASIKTASGRTSGGKHPAGKVMNCIAELYFLSLVRAPTKLLILTSPDFHELFLRGMKDKIAPGIEVVPMPLPAEIQAKVAAVQRAASDEIQPVLDANELRAVRG